MLSKYVYTVKSVKLLWFGFLVINNITLTSAQIFCSVNVIFGIFSWGPFRNGKWMIATNLSEARYLFNITVLGPHVDFRNYRM